MRDFRDAKSIATTIRDELAARGVQLSRAESLELTASAFGAADWNTLSARIATPPDVPSGEAARADPRAWADLLRPFYDRHLSPDERGGAWAQLFREAQTLYDAGTDAGSDEVLDLARRWLALADAASGGRPELRSKYSDAYKEALADPNIAPKLPLSRELLAWFGPALHRARAERRA